jgi:hypothetical protein
MDEEMITDTRHNMLSAEVLNAQAHPRIIIRSIGVSGPRWQPDMTVEITLRGHTRVTTVPVALEIANDHLIASGRFRLLQTEFGIQPFSALGGNLLGIAPKLWNATAYWENDVASVRLSYNWRDGFPLSAVGGSFGGGPNFAQTRAVKRGQFDLSASYNLPRVWSEPQITLNVINITNQEQRLITEFDNMVYETYIPGRTIMLGIRGSF